MNPLTTSLLLISLFISLMQAEGQALNIRNDVFWKTVDGRPISSQGGGIFAFTDPASGTKKYYWYGVHYKEADAYRDAPQITLQTNNFESVTCYSSTDLVKWTFESDVVTKEEVNKSRKTWVGRLGVAYLNQLKKYAMFVQHGSKVLILTADSPTGNYTWHQEISMEAMIGTSNTGDQTVFTDEADGKSYLVYSYGRGRNKIYISEIGIKDGMVNLLDCTRIFAGESREGNCMFKYQGKYYMCASNIYGWDASLAYFLVSDSIRGPYLPANDMAIMDGCAADFAHISQTGFFYTIKGSQQETVVYCGDRWANFAGNGLGYNQWCPISFTNSSPYFNSLNSWNLNAKTGTWEVAADNNFVTNASFEADRRHIPSPVKPVQEQLTGWSTTVLEGNVPSQDSLRSPVLNYFNTESDRRIVIGEKSLNISDQVKFRRKVSQIIESSKYVKINDGVYFLTAMVKNSSDFNALEMYAVSDGKTIKFAIKGGNKSWQKIAIPKVAVAGGKVEIGFYADGRPNAFCNVDDVSLIKVR